MLEGGGGGGERGQEGHLGKVVSYILTLATTTLNKKKSAAAGDGGWDELSSIALIFASPYPNKLARLLAPVQFVPMTVGMLQSLREALRVSLYRFF